MAVIAEVNLPAGEVPDDGNAEAAGQVLLLELELAPEGVGHESQVVGLVVPEGHRVAETVLVLD